MEQRAAEILTVIESNAGGDYKVYFEDIREAITRIREYTLGQSRETFGGDQYFGIDIDILWGIISNKLSELELAVTALLEE